LCVECIDPVDLAHKLRLRAETAAKQRRGKPVRFDVQPYRPHRKGQRHHGPVLVPLPLLAIRGDAMTVQEIAAVLGMSEMGVRLVEQRAMAKFEATWRAMFHREAEAAE
jgi:hypothetical protein